MYPHCKFIKNPFYIKVSPNFKKQMIIPFTWEEGNISVIRDSEEIDKKKMARR